MADSVVYKKIRIKGVVQGVGFRPFVYRTALEHKISGRVTNLGNLVEIAAAGTSDDFDSFVCDLSAKNPPLSRIDDLEILDLNDSAAEKNADSADLLFLKSATSFSISESHIAKKDAESGAGNSIIPPDTAICADCLAELKDKSNRRFLYPFTVCTNCGPRYTTVRKLPYDRENTSMDDFPLCDACRREYTSVADRRYHAQPVCCPDCGPKHFFQKSTADPSCKINPPLSFGNNALKDAANAIDAGSVVALKGYGGFHLVCDAFSEEAVSTLRMRLNRPTQPFAVMVRNETTARQIGNIQNSRDSDLLSLLQNFRRPIVVFDKSDSYSLAPSVAPRLHNIGVMLPYSGTHHVLFESLKTDCVVMTSANLPGLPMVVDNDEAVLELSNVCDFFLFHNRKIENRTDDTVIRCVADEPVFLRRSRGFVPERIRLPFSSDLGIAAVGAEMNNTISFAKDGNVYLSQYIGNTKHVKTAQYHADAFETLKRLTGIRPSAFACDLHPEFNTTKFAEELSGGPTPSPLFRIQHHHAHICSVMADNGLPIDSEIIGIAIDGVGYGDDQTVWGGEIFRCDYTFYERVASLAPQPMPGGDLASYYPARMVFGMLYPYVKNGNISKEELFDLDLYFKHGLDEKKMVLTQLENHFNLVTSTSTGRVLDTVSALLGLCKARTYDGEPSMVLESAAVSGLLESPDLNYFVPTFKCVGNRPVLDTSALLYSIYREIQKPDSERRFSKNELAVMAVHSLSFGMAMLAADACEKSGISTVGISGGVANNDYIVRTFSDYLKQKGIRFLTHKNLPPGDGCISHGQAAIAVARLLSEKSKEQ
ncbi:carbamoyltransferase HypF [Methanolapillus millepedarum]|uniref:Carbamoyltransferase n=1 Tax=Methanolapillus millepedarum TaxID=3028296 RepID=A0AA96V4F8_9EURY|nr:Carbamoyltransferase HypF [Methanosarcinaceae archaeon Ac7]